MEHKGMLVILDGWGIGKDPGVDAIFQAKTPFVDSLMKEWPNSLLKTFGENVGLPEGQMGNSEVGHLNIGAGRVVYQELLRINKAIEDGSLKEEPAIQECFKTARQRSGRLHIFGLLSDGGVHSHIDHIIALAKYAAEADLKHIYVHAFLDGRDTDPQGGEGYIKDLFKGIQGTPVRLATVIGRYYAMDRDKRWERTRKAYDLLVRGEGTFTDDVLSTIRDFYNNGTTDEFMKPILLERDGLVRDGDSVLFANFRTDRPRQLTEVLTQKDHPEQDMHVLDLDYTIMTRYDDKFRNMRVVYDNKNIEKTMGEWLSEKGKTQLRAAETEKYPHVTFFFSGGREETFTGENRIMVPSPKVATYDLQPEMSAPELNEKVMGFIQTNEPDFICLNFANTDMVGHTGVFIAAMKAAETVDGCLSELIPMAVEKGYRIMIIADHGNSDHMVNPDGSPNTAHSVNPVPCIVVGNGLKNASISDGVLADVAPTLLDMMGIDKPALMTGKVLIHF